MKAQVGDYLITAPLESAESNKPQYVRVEKVRDEYYRVVAVDAYCDTAAAT